MNEQKTIRAAKPRSAGAAVKALAWREWRLVRKDFISSMSIFFVLTALFWLIRLSMSVMTTEEEIDAAVGALKEIIPFLRRYTRH